MFKGDEQQERPETIQIQAFGSKDFVQVYMRVVNFEVMELYPFLKVSWNYTYSINVIKSKRTKIEQLKVDGLKSPKAKSKGIKIEQLKVKDLNCTKFSKGVV